MSAIKPATCSRPAADEAATDRGVWSPNDGQARSAHSKYRVSKNPFKRDRSSSTEITKVRGSSAANSDSLTWRGGGVEVSPRKWRENPNVAASLCLTVSSRSRESHSTHTWVPVRISLTTTADSKAPHVPLWTKRCAFFVSEAPPDRGAIASCSNPSRAAGMSAIYPYSRWSYRANAYR